MKTKIQIKSIFGTVLFEYEKEDNTIKDTVTGAYLRGADLTGAYLTGAKNIESAKMPMFCKWSHSVIGDKIQIGCKENTIEGWDAFFCFK